MFKIDFKCTFNIYVQLKKCFRGREGLVGEKAEILRLNKTKSAIQNNFSSELPTIQFQLKI